MTMRVGWFAVPTVGTILALALAAAPLGAQVRTIDPNQGIDSDLAPSQAAPRAPSPSPRASQQTGAPQNAYPANADAPPPYPQNAYPQDTATPTPSPRYPDPPANGAPAQQQNPVDVAAQDGARAGADASAAQSQTFQQGELLAAAEGTFGKGASGLAGILERTLKEQGEPNAYISGREASGAVVVGLRYGKGTMFHKVEGEQPVYWTGPSIGFDLGGDANKVFVLVYNLYDSAELFHRFPAAEGRVYFVGGFAASYLRRGNTVLIPIRLGVGWRQGVNLGYMKFNKTSKWFPF
ncbi:MULTISPECIES: DUF1134 domain-containing protein [unclassified Sphingomonas]|uniref:DUF1134 domain-containing protein n=1 Tax=unclassified Sphingomonas TaxID=196159 RepID=UPI001F59AB18|nr:MULTISPECIES: DUF1134 domain-containing protein [unclassified Sphingomonas]